MKLPIAIDADLPPNTRNVFVRVGRIGLSESAHGPQPDNDRVNAEFIVRAVNHHDDLVAMLERFIRNDFAESRISLNEARALLAKVKL